MTIERIVELGALAVILSSFWMVFVLLVRVTVARWLGARWAYFLWLTPLLGLLAMGIPNQPVQRMLDIPGIEVPVVNSAFKTASRIFNSTEKPITARPASMPESKWPSVQPLVLIAWMSGTFFSLLYFLTRNSRFLARMRRASLTLTDQQASRVRSRCPGLTHVPETRFRMLPGARGVAVVGLTRPVLLLPLDFFERYTVQQQVLILEHELQHLRSHDLFCLLLARVYCSVFWFNPLVYIAERYLQLDQELACDEKVLVSKDRATRRVYGETLLLSANERIRFPQLSYSPSFGQIKQRTYMLKHYRQHVLASFLGGLLVMACVGTSVTYGALGSLKLEPDLSIREDLRQPIEAALKELENDALGHERLQVLQTSLNHLETAFPEQPLSNSELAQLNDLLALIHFRQGDFDQSLFLYKKVISLTDDVPGHQSRTLDTIAGIQFALGDYVETIKALEWSRAVSPVAPSAESWALRSRAFVRLQHWDQALRFVKRAIERAEAVGNVPSEDWLLSQTALQWKLGDLEGAARSLEKSIEIFPEVTYEQTLLVFNDLVQEVWEAPANDRSLAQF